MTYGDWQPIETAPKDGTRILLWIEPTKIAMPFEWKDGRWMGDDYPLNMAWATHWMPMPEPPASGIETEGQDRETGLGAKHESPVANGETP